MAERVVDAHAHVFRPAAVAPRAVDELAPAGRDAPVERLLDAMGRAGVDQAVLVPLGEEDDVVAAAIAAYPGRFAAVAVAGPAEQGRDDARDAAAAVARRLDATGFGGLRTTWLGEPGRPLTASPMLPGLRELAGRRGVLWAYLPPDQAPLLAELADAVPDLDVVLNHLGFAPDRMRVDAAGRPAFDVRLPPERVEFVHSLAQAPRMHLMVSGLYALSAEPAPHADVAPAVHRLCEAFGARRLLWGSDFPWIEAEPGYATTLDAIRGLVPADAHPDLLGATARRLFPTLDDEGAPHAARR